MNKELEKKLIKNCEEILKASKERQKRQTIKDNLNESKTGVQPVIREVTENK